MFIAIKSRHAGIVERLLHERWIDYPTKDSKDVILIAKKLNELYSDPLHFIVNKMLDDYLRLNRFYRVCCWHY
jgi:hypothetical protein